MKRVLKTYVYSKTLASMRLMRSFVRAFAVKTTSWLYRHKMNTAARGWLVGWLLWV